MSPTLPAPVWGLEPWPVLAALVAVILYAGGVRSAGRRGRAWSRLRSVCWLGGVLACLAAVTGPLAELGHESFTAHMVGHLLLGMAGPLLLVRAAPATLALRALGQRPARALVRVLCSRPLAWASHPVVAGLADLGGLWVLYRTPLFAWLHTPAVHLLVSVHVLVWGYLFAAAVVGVDPLRHRRSLRYRAIVLVAFAAGHGVLAKLVYASPPPGVPAVQAERGAMVMYYGGDLVDLVLFVLLCSAWYAADGRRSGFGRGGWSPEMVEPFR